MPTIRELRRSHTETFPSDIRRAVGGLRPLRARVISSTPSERVAAFGVIPPATTRRARWHWRNLWAAVRLAAAPTSGTRIDTTWELPIGDTSDRRLDDQQLWFRRGGQRAVNLWRYANLRGDADVEAVQRALAAQQRRIVDTPLANHPDVDPLRFAVAQLERGRAAWMLGANETALQDATATLAHAAFRLPQSDATTMELTVRTQLGYEGYATWGAVAELAGDLLWLSGGEAGGLHDAYATAVALWECGLGTYIHTHALIVRARQQRNLPHHAVPHDALNGPIGSMVQRDPIIRHGHRVMARLEPKVQQFLPDDAAPGPSTLSLESSDA